MRAAFASRIGTRAAEAKTLHEISVPPICCPRPARRPSWPCIRTGVAQGRCPKVRAAVGRPPTRHISGAVPAHRNDLRPLASAAAAK